jgi:hypothetical protein
MNLLGDIWYGRCSINGDYVYAHDGALEFLIVDTATMKQMYSFISIYRPRIAIWWFSPTIFLVVLCEGILISSVGHGLFA